MLQGYFDFFDNRIEYPNTVAMCYLQRACHKMSNIKPFPRVLCCCHAMDHNTLQKRVLNAGHFIGTHMGALDATILLYFDSQLGIAMLQLETTRSHIAVWATGSRPVCA